jgi:tetratricopeptide (TPR) repeat protein
LFLEALAEYQAGRLPQSERLCEQVLAADPNHAEALHLAGIAAFLSGRHQRAVELIRNAIAVNPAPAAYYNSLGASLHGMNQWEEAAAEYRTAIRLKPDYVDALSNLGGVLYDLGRLEEALPYSQRAIALNGSDAKAHRNLGLTLHALGRGEAAERHLRRAVDLAPDNVEMVQRYAYLLVELNRTQEAVPHLARITKQKPDCARAWQLLGQCYQGLDQSFEAASCYQKALDLHPDSMEATNNLGNCLAAAGERREALALFRKAIDLKPDSPIAWCNAGQMMKDLGLAETALRCFQMALRLDPNYPPALWNRSLCLLALGRLAEGWADYDWRWEMGPHIKPRPFSQPRWAGEDLAGKAILVWMEQGLGDHILLSSMIPDLVRVGAHCVVECDERLLTLFARSFPTVEVIASADSPHPRTVEPGIDCQIAAGSLARWLRADLASFPQHRGFLVPDPRRAAHWRKRVEELGEGLKVGICWRSMMHGGKRAMYYSRLHQWGGILTAPGVQFVNLQYDESGPELDEAERLFGTRIHRWDDLDLKQDQEGVAALISTLDLVISAGTAVDQMAGALGVSTWVLTREATGVWSLGTDHCPWYPSVRAFLCGAKDPWETVLEQMAKELHQLDVARIA